MNKVISIGKQDFEQIRKQNYFYIDKTNFIQEWWESGDDVTLITRPRRFGKTLNMDIGMNLLLLSGVFLIRHLRRIHIWNVQ